MALCVQVMLVTQLCGNHNSINRRLPSSLHIAKMYRCSLIIICGVLAGTYVAWYQNRSSSHMPSHTLSSSSVAAIARNKIVVYTLKANTGGPEALFQLAIALFHYGHSVYCTSEPHEALQPYYPEWRKLSIVAFEEVDKLLQPGDAIIIPEVVECTQPVLSRLHPRVRRIQWILAGSAHNPHPPCTFIHHTFYLARANRSPLTSVVMPYIHRNRSGLALDRHDLMAQKTNLVCLSHHTTSHLKPGLLRSSYLRSFALPGFEVKVIEGLTPQGVVDVLMRCKLFIDGKLPGMERLALEAVALHAILLLNPSDGIGEDFLDFPLPIEYLGPWTDEHSANSSNGTRFEQAIIKALTSYEKEVLRFSAMRNRIAGLEQQFETAVDNLFQQSSLFVVPCNAAVDQENCLLAGASALLVNPVSVVAVVLDRSEMDEYVKTHSKLLAALEAVHMKGSIHIQALHIDTFDWFKVVATGAPNGRIVALSPGSVVLRFQQYLHLDATIPAPRQCQSWRRLREALLDDACAAILLPMQSGVLLQPTTMLQLWRVRKMLDGREEMSGETFAALREMCAKPLWRDLCAFSQMWSRLCEAVIASS